LALAADLLEVHMYSSFAALQGGWKRIFIEASRRRVRRLRKKALVVLVLGVGTPIVQIAALATGAAAGHTAFLWAVAVVAWGVAAQAVALAVVYRACRARVRDVLLSPVSAAFVAQVLWQGAEDLANSRPVRWGGREYRLIPED
jgi:hypothetical protein